MLAARRCSVHLARRCLFGARALSNAPTLEQPAASIICGKTISATIREECKDATAQLFETTGIRPGLAVILVGDRPDSATYVGAKKKACQEIGIVDIGTLRPHLAYASPHPHPMCGEGTRRLRSTPLP